MKKGTAKRAVVGIPAMAGIWAVGMTVEIAAHIVTGPGPTIFKVWEKGMVQTWDWIKDGKVNNRDTFL